MQEYNLKSQLAQELKTRAANFQVYAERMRLMSSEFPNASIDDVLGSLGNTHFVQLHEIQESDKRIERLTQQLESIYNAEVIANDRR
jgi:uncharacterized protein YdcH (DUF465 family)